MKEYFKDYWHLCKETNKFYKKHWFGTMVLTIGGIALMIGPTYVQAKKFEKSLNDIHKEVYGEVSEEES